MQTTIFHTVFFLAEQTARPPSRKVAQPFGLLISISELSGVSSWQATSRSVVLRPPASSPTRVSYQFLTSEKRVSLPERHQETRDVSPVLY